MAPLNPQQMMRHAFDAMQAGRGGEAELLCQQLLSQQPHHAGALHMLGLLASRRGDYPRAIDLLRQSLAIAPTISDFHNNLGETLLAAGQVEAAIASYREAIRLNAADAQPHNNLANALRRLGKLDEAIALYKKAIELNAALPQAHFNLGDAYKEQHKLDEAEAHLRRAIELKADYVSALQTLGLVMLERGRLDEALAAYDRALAIDPNAAQVHFNKSIVLLIRGNLKEGWPEYEWRLKCSAFGSRTFDKPRWNGDFAALKDRTLLVHVEQGMGDTIQFMRYVPMLAEHGPRIILECPQPLVSLLQIVSGVSRAIASGSPAGDFDLHVPLLSLAGAFNTTLETIPKNVPYIAADPSRAAQWKGKLPNATQTKRIGLVWSGGSNPPDRSCKLADFAPLASVAKANFFSLQLGDASRQLSSPPARLTIHDLASQITDFTDTAAILANLDLLISVDTAAAHLAGAMGRPVWTILKHAADFRWLLDRIDSPWYPTMKLFRQRIAGDWSASISQIASELHKL